MRGGSAIYCPACKHRQVVGEAGQKLGLPLVVPCEKCGATITIERSESGGAHVTTKDISAP